MEYRPENNDIPENEEQKKKPGTAAKIAVLILLILLLAAGIILPIKLVPNAFNATSSTFTSWFNTNWFNKASSSTLSVDKTPIAANDQFLLSWSGKYRSDGSYILNYSCTKDFSLETSVSKPHETVPCSTDYYFTPTSSNIVLVAHSKTSGYEVPISLSFLENGTASTTNIASTTLDVGSPILATATTTPSKPVTSKPATTTPPTPKPVPVPTPTPKPTPKPTPTPKPVFGPSDLSVRIISTGSLDDNGIYTPRASVTAGSRAAVRFVVTNIGGKSTGPWSFTATLPSVTRPSYTAKNLQSIASGRSIEFTLGFDEISAGSQPVRITVIGDTTAANNTALIYIQAR